MVPQKFTELTFATRLLVGPTTWVLRELSDDASLTLQTTASPCEKRKFDRTKGPA
jgi:hypothetical protein